MRWSITILAVVATGGCSLFFGVDAGDDGSAQSDAGPGDEIDADGVGGMPDADLPDPCEPEGQVTTPLGCRECFDNADCSASGVCNHRNYECVDESTIVYVDGAGVDSPGCGGLADPCQSLGVALTRLSQNQREWIHLASGQHSVTNTLALGALLGSSSLTISGEESTQLNFDTGNTLGVDVNSGVSLSVQELEMRGPTGGSALACKDATIRLVDVTQRDAGQRALTSTGCEVDIVRTRFHGNGATAIVAIGGVFAMFNSIVDGNGNSLEAAGGVLIDVPGSPVQFHFNTIVNNVASPEDVKNPAGGVLCTSQTVMAGAGNIITNNQGANNVLGDTCIYFHSNVAGYSGSGIIDSQPTFESSTATPFELQANSPELDIDELMAFVSQGQLDFSRGLRIVGAAPDMGAQERED